MKKKQLLAIALAATVALTSVPVLAATGTKTAILNNAQVRFNDGSIQTIQCYNIDGYNYVRARDIGQNLNMEINSIKNGTAGVYILPDLPSKTAGAAEKLTKQSVQVNVIGGYLDYDQASSIETECFLLDGRYYFKLADFQKTSEQALKSSLELVKIEATGGIATKPFKEKMSTISVEWDKEARVIDVSRVDTDLQKVFDDAHTGKETVVSDVIDNSEKVQQEEIKTQAALTSAPKEGEILADILIDDNEGAYLDSSMTKLNLENFTPTYRNVGGIGECTWYARARFIETVGEYIDDNPYYMGIVSDWVKNAQSDNCPDLDGITDPYAIQPRSIAIWKGHAAFVEWVDYDSNGTPTNVYFTEANAGHTSTSGQSVNGMRDGIYYPDFDCKVKVMKISDFINRASFIGYIVTK